MYSLLRSMTCFLKQDPGYLLYMRDSVLEEYGWICIVKKELTAGICSTEVWQRTEK